MNNFSYENEPKVRAWKDSVVKAGCTILSLSPLNTFYKKNNELLFALLRADVSDPKGNKLHDILFVRGHACIVVPQIRNKTTDEKAFLMIRQRRIGNGTVNLEFPAGMLDRNIHIPEKVAVKELFEETGLKVLVTDLFPLCDRPLLSSPGASDEGIYYFGCSVTVAGHRFTEFEGRVISGVSENENIAVTLKSRRQAEKETTSLQARLGFYLFENFQKKQRTHENIFRKRKHPKKPS
jgi:NTP pyrophosphohydrolases including oxidative damage repair enzymes